MKSGKLSAVRLPACAEASAGRRRLSEFSRGDFFAPSLRRSEMGSNYFKNGARKLDSSV